MKFTPDIKFINDETLNEFVVTVERRDVGGIYSAPLLFGRPVASKL